MCGALIAIGSRLGPSARGISCDHPPFCPSQGSEHREDSVRIALAPRSSFEHAANRGDVKALCGAKVERLVHRAWSAFSPNACPICAQRVRGAKQRAAKPTVRAKQELDRLVGAMVRASGPCAAIGDGHPCRGPLQWAHIVSRRYLATRWLLENSMPLCSGHHRWYTLAPLEWEVFVVSKIGATRYESLKQQALSGKRPDYAALLARLRGQEGAA